MGLAANLGRLDLVLMSRDYLHMHCGIGNTVQHSDVAIETSHLFIASTVILILVLDMHHACTCCMDLNFVLNLFYVSFRNSFTLMIFIAFNYTSIIKDK